MFAIITSWLKRSRIATLTVGSHSVRADDTNTMCSGDAGTSPSAIFQVPMKKYTLGIDGKVREEEVFAHRALSEKKPQI